jgi:hypothetical protein
MKASMSPIGTKRTLVESHSMSAFGGKADIPFDRRNVRF